MMGVGKRSDVVMFVLFLVRFLGWVGGGDRRNGGKRQCLETSV